jgi:hypothetical protein
MRLRVRTLEYIIPYLHGLAGLRGEKDSTGFPQKKIFIKGILPPRAQRSPGEKIQNI